MIKPIDQKKTKHVLFSVLGIVLLEVTIFITNLITNREPSLLSISIVTPIIYSLFAFSVWNITCILENEKLRAMLRLFIRISAILCIFMSVVLVGAALSN